MARAPVSKTGGWGFESLLSCHEPPPVVRVLISLAFLIMTALGATSPAFAAGTLPVFAEGSPCAPAPGTPAHVWHISAMGDDSAGDGSLERPWKTLGALFAPGPWGAPKLSSVVVRGAQNPAAPVHPGDAVLIADAPTSYGALNLSGVANNDWLTIGAEPGAHPLVDDISIWGSKKIAFVGLKVESLKFDEKPLVGGGDMTDIRFDDMLLESAPDAVVATWSAQEHIAKARDAVEIRSGQCVMFTSTVMFRNVRNGVFFASNWSAFSGTIDGGDDDFIRPGCSHCYVVGARGVNSNTVGDGNHNDFIQIFFGPFDDIRIADNVFIRDAGRVYFPGEIQGIDDFGSTGTMTHVVVENNVVVTSGVCHGITFLKTNGGRIVSNFVRGDGVVPQPGKCPVWIMLYPDVTNVAVSGNLAEGYKLPPGLSGVTYGLNLCIAGALGCRAPLPTVGD